MRGVASPEVINEDIYVVVLPFVAIIPKGLVLLFLYPPLATYLPKAIGW